ncbi:MAG: hypothetical protein HYV42_02805 [Candidatus Magasanikbacteria bacterium]|nr:hypothetical protein [Candidatus Magasanikbacteria bacterium]
MFLIVLERLAIEAILDLFYFPLWWYSGGLNWAGLQCLGLLRRGNRRLAPGLWLRNIFVPMYGQYDWQGRAISIFMRLVNVIGRSIALLGWLVVCWGLFLVWLLLPAAAILGIIGKF